jgi:hypothetical protein
MNPDDGGTYIYVMPDGTLKIERAPCTFFSDYLAAQMIIRIDPLTHDARLLKSRHTHPGTFHL